MRISTLLIIAVVAGGSAALVSGMAQPAPAAAAPTPDATTAMYLKSGVHFIALPGSVAGGVEVCRDREHAECFTTPDAGLPVQLLVYNERDGVTVGTNEGRPLIIEEAAQLSVDYKGCDMSLASWLAKSYCPGVH